MSMQEYEVKRGHTADLEQHIVDGLTELFGRAPENTGGHYVISYGSLKKLEVWPGEKSKTVLVNTVTDDDVLRMPESESDPIILDTNKRFRQFLDLITGFTTKERVKRAKKAAEQAS